MATSNHASIRSRKPFKLLEHFSDAERLRLEQELTFLESSSDDPVYGKLRLYFQQWAQHRKAPEPLTRDQFIAGTSLPERANAFDKLTSFFYNFLQDFLARLELEQDPIASQHLAFRAYRNRGLEWQDIRRRHTEAHRKLDKLPQSSRLHEARLFLDLDFATLSSNRNIPHDQRGYPDLLAALDANYAIQKLRLLCAIINDRKIFAGGQAPPESEPSIPLPQSTWPPLAQLYHGVYQMLCQGTDPELMNRIHQLLEAQDPKARAYPRADMLDLYGYLLNELAWRVNAGDEAALHNLSRLHDQLIRTGLIYQKGKIEDGHFKNMISVKLIAGDPPGMRRVFEELKDKVHNDPGENCVRYNHALLLFAEEKLDQAARELEKMCAQTHNLNLDLFYGLDMRGYLLRVYYDQLQAYHAQPRRWDATDEKMQRLLEAYKGYIERRKLPARHRERYESLRKLIQAMYLAAFRAPHHSTEREIEELKELAQKSSRTLENWFRVRLERLDVRLQ